MDALVLLGSHVPTRSWLAIRALNQHCRALVDRSAELQAALQAHPFVQGRVWQHRLHNDLNVGNLRNNWDSFRDVRCTMRMLSRLRELATFQAGRDLQYRLDYGGPSIDADDLDLDAMRAAAREDRLWNMLMGLEPNDGSVQIRFGPLDSRCRAAITIVERKGV